MKCILTAGGKKTIAGQPEKKESEIRLLVFCFQDLSLKTTVAVIETVSGHNQNLTNNQGEKNFFIFFWKKENVSYMFSLQVSWPPNGIKL